jgi:hypothetical protein
MLIDRIASRLFLASVITVVAFALGLSVLAAPGAGTPNADPVVPPTHASPNAQPVAPRFHATGGPYIAIQDAVAIANHHARGPITLQASHQLTYGEAAAWMGSFTYTVAAGREVYLVVTQAPFTRGGGPLGPITCGVFFAVVDATDGTVWALGCRGNTWPALPSAFAH